MPVFDHCYIHMAKSNCQPKSAIATARGKLVPVVTRLFHQNLLKIKTWSYNFYGRLTLEIVAANSLIQLCNMHNPHQLARMYFNIIFILYHICINHLPSI